MKYLKIKFLFFLILTIVIIKPLSACDASPPEESTIEKETALSSIGNDELTTLLEDENNFFLYFGRPTCPFCQEFKPILEEVVEQLDVIVYYFNTDVAREQDEQQLEFLTNMLGILSVPTMLYIENGVVIIIENGVLATEELTEFFEAHQ